MNNKHTILTAIILFLSAIFIALAFFILTPIVLQKCIEKEQKQGNIVKATNVTNLLISLFPSSDEAFDVIFSELPFSSDPAHGQEDIIVGSTFTSISHEPARALVYNEDFVKKVLRVADVQEEMWKWNIYERLAGVLSSKGEFSLAEEYFLEAQEGFNKTGSISRERMVYYYLSNIALFRGDKEKQFSYLDQINDPRFENCGESDGLSAELGFLYLERGNEDRAEELFNKTVTYMEEWYEESKLVDDMAFILEEQPAWQKAKVGLSKIEAMKMKKSPNLEKKVEGIIMYGCTPLSNVQIRLIPLTDEDYFCYNILEYSEKSQRGVSALDGSFSIFEIPDGAYKVLLGFSVAQLEGAGRFSVPENIIVEKDKVAYINITVQKRIDLEPHQKQTLVYGENFLYNWAPVNNAQYYVIQLYAKMGDSSVGAEIDRIKETSYTLNIENYKYLDDLFYGSLNDKKIEAIALNIQAYDEKDTLLSDSNGFLYDEAYEYSLLLVE